MTQNNHSEIFDKTMIDELREVGGDAFLQDLIDMFLNTVPQKILEIEKAFAKDEFAFIHHEVHKLKSSSASLGAVRFSSSCFKIERLTLKERQLKQDESLKKTLSTLINELKNEFIETQKYLEKLKI